MKKNKYFEKGMEYYSEGNFENAIKEFNKAINSDNQFIKSEFYYKRANAKLLSKNIYKNNEILIDFNKAIEIEEKPEYYIARGLLKFDISNYGNGIKDLEIASSNFNTYKNLDEIFFDAGMKCAYKEKYPAALECFTKAIELNSTESEYYFLRAQVTINYIADNKYLSDKLIYEYSQKKKSWNKKNSGVIKYYAEEPKEITFNKTTDNLKIEEFNYDNAIKDFSKAISLKEDPEYYFMRGQALNSIKSNFKKKISDYSKAISLKEDSRYYYHRGLTILKKWGVSIEKWDSTFLRDDFPSLKHKFKKRFCHSLSSTEEPIAEFKEAIADFDYVKNYSHENFNRYPFPDKKANYMLSFLNERRTYLIRENIKNKRFEEEKNKFLKKQNKLFKKLNIKFKYLPIIILMIPFVRFLIKSLTN